jgi:L-fucose mutarotase/ribose pyranase (RbsD/FucU family)
MLMMPLGGFAQQEKIQPPPASLEQKQEMSENQMQECEEVMSRLYEMDARLDAKIVAMDAAAKGDQKVEAIAAVIKEMVSQRKEMQEQMLKMQNVRREQMMQHTKSVDGK